MNWDETLRAAYSAMKYYTDRPPVTVEDWAELRDGFNKVVGSDRGFLYDVMNACYIELERKYHEQEKN